MSKIPIGLFLRFFVLFMVMFLFAGAIVLKIQRKRQTELFIKMNRVPDPEVGMVLLEAGDTEFYAETPVKLERIRKGINGRLYFFRPDVGILLAFPADEPAKLQLSDIRVNSQMAFLRPDGWIEQIFEVRKGQAGPLVTDRPCRYILAMAEGWFTEHGLATGSVIKLPAGLKPVKAYGELLAELEAEAERKQKQATQPADPTQNKERRNDGTEEKQESKDKG